MAEPTGADRPRVVLAGNNDAAVNVLRLLQQALADDEILVLAPAPETRPDWHPSLATAARSAGLRCLTPTNVNDPEIVAELEAFGATHLLSVYYTQLFKRPLLDAVGMALNFHPSLLPRHRGTAPLIWAIAEGDATAGLTVHRIDLGVDTGHVLYSLPIPIHPDDTGYELHQKLVALVRSTAVDIINRLVGGRPLPLEKEQVGPSSYHSSQDPQLNHLRWDDPPSRLRNIVRALAPPLPGAYVMAGDRKLILARLSVMPPDASGRGAPAGMVRVRHRERPLVLCGDGAVQIDAYVDEQEGRVVDGHELITGGLLQEGDVLQ